MPARPPSDVVEADGAQALAPVAGQIGAMRNFLHAEAAAGRSHLPAGEHILRVFT